MIRVWGSWGRGCSAGGIGKGRSCRVSFMIIIMIGFRVANYRVRTMMIIVGVVVRVAGVVD